MEMINGTRGFDCKQHVELSGWCCNSSSEQMISYYKRILEHIPLISPLTVIVDRYLIVARRTAYACGNSMHLFIEFLFESQASLNKRAVQLLAWLRIFVSARSKMWPVSTWNFFVKTYHLFWRRIVAPIWKLNMPLIVKSPCSIFHSDCHLHCSIDKAMDSENR